MWIHRDVTSRGTFGLLLVSLIWGLTFVAVKPALTAIPPLLFVGLRFALAAVTAAAILPWLPRSRTLLSRPRPRRDSLVAGVPLGIIIAGAYAAQCRGLITTTPARSAFITGLNVPLVPIWAWILTRRRPGLFPLLGLLLVLPGLWLLTTPQAGSWNPGDFWTLGCALLYALYVVQLTKAGADHDPAGLLVSQLAVTALISLGASLLLEHPHFHLTWKLAGILVFLAWLATLLTTWMQIRLQPEVGSTRSAILFATEPVFAALFSWALIGERLTAAACAGGGFILAGMVLSELGSAKSEVDSAGKPGLPDQHLRG